MKKVLISLVVVAASGCGIVSAPSPFQDGHVLISGDAKGVRAYMDGLNGLVTNGKASPDIKSAHWQMRDLEEVNITQRAYAPGFLQKLFGTGQGATTGGN